MPEKQAKKAGPTAPRGKIQLHELPEIAKGIKYLAKHHPALREALDRIDRMERHRGEAGFPGLVSIILGQQVSMAAAASMRRKLGAKCRPLTPRKFLKLTDDELRACGLSRQKINYCRDIAERFVDKSFKHAALEAMSDEEAIAELVKLKGIGVWSAEVYLLFCLGRPDIWPAGDLGIQTGLQRLFKLKKRPDHKKARQLGEAFAPHRSAASFIVWQA